jgi:hypothetical protein
MKTTRFIISTKKSSCFNADALLVRSRKGGFVSRNCLKCLQRYESANLTGLPTIECEFCGTMLT